MSDPQPGILDDLPSTGRYLEFSLKPDEEPAGAVARLAEENIDKSVVVGLGPSVCSKLGYSIDGLRPFPALSGPGCSVPSTQADIWIWLRGDDRGDLLHRGRSLQKVLSDAFQLERVVDAFKYGSGLDLTGYEDGTENPGAEDAPGVALTEDGSSFVAVQQWHHNLDHFATLPQSEQDFVIGRRLSDNEELDDAPASAHVKRTAQESFDPEAFVWRRSMPYVDGNASGLQFVAFANTLDAFEVQMRRMVGEEDGITDALFRFSHPETGSYFWCPPLSGGRLDLSGIGL